MDSEAMFLQINFVSLFANCKDPHLNALLSEVKDEEASAWFLGVSLEEFHAHEDLWRHPHLFLSLYGRQLYLCQPHCQW